LELLEPDVCLELEEAIDEQKVKGVLGFQFERKEIDFHKEYTHKLKSVEKVNKMCVIDIYSVFVTSFHIQRGQNRHLINDRNRGREKICLKAYNHYCP